MARDFIEVAVSTDVGNVRQFNEDSVATDAERGLAILADGMGGHRAGEVAGRMATEIILSTLQADVGEFRSNTGPHSASRVVNESINRANSAIFSAAASHPHYQGMGTTLALVLFHDNRVTLAHLGDSRIYRLRASRLNLLTRDDSLLRDQIELGLIAAADAAESHNRSLVTRALGIEASVSAHVRDEEALPGDVFLLCSDGLNDLVDDDDIELIVDSLKSNLPLAANHLVQTAKDNGGYDNVSVILVRVQKPFPASSQAGWMKRVFGWLR